VQFWKKYRVDFRQNLILALPIMGGQLGQVLVNLADNLMVGKLGAVALASVSLANAVFIVFLVFGMGISFALPPLVSEADGAGESQKISQYFKHSFIVNISFAILSLFIIILGLPLLYHLGQDVEIIPFAKEYLTITAWSLLPLMVLQTLRCYCDGLSNTLYPMIALISGNIINVFLNYGLIFGNMGMPRMGVAGAATASMIARISMVIILLVFIKKKARLWQYLEDIQLLKVQEYMFRKVLALGIPSSFQMFFEVTAFSGAAIIMGMLGKNPQAAHQISINLASTTFLICTGIGMAATIRVGNQLGRRNQQGVRDAGFSAVLQVIMIMTTTAFIFVLGRSFLPTLYISDQEVIEIASLLMIMAAIFQIPDGIQVTMLGALRGIQDVKIPTAITFFAYWMVGIPISYLSAIIFDFGPLGVWTGLIAGLSLSAALLTWRYHKITLALPLMNP
jgi:MATE family multidrug resistance protein